MADGRRIAYIQQYLCNSLADFDGMLHNDY